MVPILPAADIRGTLLYAHRLSEGGTYSVTVVDVLSKSITPFETSVGISTGLAQHVRDIGPGRVFVVTTVRTLAGGENVGYLWTGGGGFAVGIGRGFSAMPILRVIKSSLTDFQASYGLVIGWGGSK